MHKNNVDIAESYYLAMGKKNTSEMAPYLHPNVEFIGPLGTMQGKEVLIEATKKLTSLYNSLLIRTKFGSGDQVMIAYDLDCPAPIGNFRVAALMSLRAGLIEKIELFYDARPFDKKKEEVCEDKNSALSASNT